MDIYEHIPLGKENAIHSCDLEKITGCESSSELRKLISSGKGTGMIKLVVNLDSRTVLERLINTAKEMQMSNGQNVFELGR